MSNSKSVIDIKQIEDDLYTPLKNYIEIPQLIIGQQDDIPEDDLIYPRIVFKISSPYGNNQVQSYTKKIIESQEEEFDKDIEYTFEMFPMVTVSFLGYSDPQDDDLYMYMQRIANWFNLRLLGGRFFNEYEKDIVVREVNDINDATTELNQEYEKRLNIDIMLQIKHEITVIEKTIEKVVIEVNNNEQMEIDL